MEETHVQALEVQILFFIQEKKQRSFQKTRAGTSPRFIAKDKWMEKKSLIY